MKSIAASLGVGGCAIVAVVALVLLSWGGYLAYLKWVYPQAQTLQFQGVKHSQGYVQSQNAHAEDLIRDYEIAKENGDKAHMSADHQDICNLAHTLDPSELYSDVSQFISFNPC